MPSYLLAAFIASLLIISSSALPQPEDLPVDNPSNEKQTHEYMNNEDSLMKEFERLTQRIADLKKMMGGLDINNELLNEMEDFSNLEEIYNQIKNRNYDTEDQYSGEGEQFDQGYSEGEGYSQEEEQEQDEDEDELSNEATDSSTFDKTEDL